LVSVGQTIACIDPQDAKDNLSNAKASLNEAQSFLTLSVSNEARQKILLSKGVITNETYENALSQLQSAQAKVDGANASLNQAQNRLEYTNLQMDVAGVVTSTEAEAGEIIKAGQAIISVATNEGLDAVFNVPEQLFHNENKITNLPVEVSLSHSPNIKTIGIVREISPQADSITRTFTVKVALNNPPKELKLGSTVTGSVSLNQGSAIEIPVMAYELLGRKRPSFKKDLADLLLFPFYPLRSADFVHTHGLLCHSHCLRFLQKNFASITYLPKNIYA